ncbi:MAG: restriction endonuclease subunit S [Deltaproteobacteria bacterium]|nr:restriction endonuclease subunit S [Deltaproteobacteria bacterium]
MVSEWPWIPAFDSAEDIEEDLIPEGWQVKQIEDLYHQLPIGKRFDKKSASSSGTVPVIDQSANGVIGWHDESPGIMASQESPVVTFANHTCEMRLMRRPFSVIQNVFPLVGKEGVCDTRFLYYGTKGRVHLEEYKGHYPDFRRKWILVPPLPEQRAIAHILGTLDDKIELNRRMNRTLEAIAQAIFKSWFLAAGKPIPDEFADRAARRAQLAHGESPLPENIRRLFPDEFQDSELGLIPKGWKVGTVADLGNIVCGKTPPTSEPANYGNEIPFITIPDMRDKAFVTTTARYLSPTGAATQPKKLLPPLSVCVSCIATPGLVALTSQPSHTNQQINSIICRDDISPYWCYSKLVNMKNEIITGGAGGSATLNLNKGQFSSLKLVLPDKHVIVAFHAKTRSLFRSILVNIRQIDCLREIRDTLLPNLISGHILLGTKLEGDVQ